MRKSNDLTEIRKVWLSDLAESIAIRYTTYGKVELWKILLDYRITHSISDYGSYFDGLLEYHKGRFHIYLNERQQERRIRFSLAHELGHYFIDEHANALASGVPPALSKHTGYASEFKVEREADYFASCLLMPKTEVIALYRKFKKFSWSIIDAIEEKFEVSKLSAIYRVVNLDLHPMMVVKGQENGLSLPPWRSKDFYFYLSNSTKIPEYTMMYEYFKNGTKYSKTQDLYAPDWFESAKSETPIHEHCIYYDAVNICYSAIWQD
ncbi:MAG TPA: ImmA/IrrE family metallo-endopeptidase [Saprospiraceae bacterium]|nr:ImmA/IrrE family metallo-endopeptidase [Saprospiraceae bacterium]